MSGLGARQSGYLYRYRSLDLPLDHQRPTHLFAVVDAGQVDAQVLGPPLHHLRRQEVHKVVRQARLQQLAVRLVPARRALALVRQQRGQRVERGGEAAPAQRRADGLVQLPDLGVALVDLMCV